MDLPNPRRLQPRHTGRSPLQRHFLRLKSLSGKIPYKLLGGQATHRHARQAWAMRWTGKYATSSAGSECISFGRT